MRKIWFILFITFCSLNSYAQEDQEPIKNLFTVAIGYTYIPKGSEEGATSENGVFVPSVGIDYFRKIHPKWDVGTMIDLELGEYLIFEKNLNRSYALLVLGVAAYNPFDHLAIFVGAGAELEKHKSFFISRLGVEYAIHLKKEWILGPGVFLDIKEGYDTWAFGLSFGREF